MGIPVATYRVQFNDEFRFSDALALVPHLHRLGITHLYASPVFAARPGSSHGYDVVDPNRLSPALGTQEDFDRLVGALHEREMGLILDIVPNHMAASLENQWWMDVLENGQASRFAGYFGINWGTADTLGEKVFLPILGSPYGEVLDRGELRLAYEQTGFQLQYYEHRLPISLMTYPAILEPLASEIVDTADFLLLMEMISRLPPHTATEWESLETRTREKERIKEKLWELCSSHQSVREHVHQRLEQLNGNTEELHAILEQQAYRVAFWKAATEKINFRRFFDITDLIGVRIEDPAVFRDTHALILEMVEKGHASGLRIDHIDGLADPLEYLERLPHQKVYVVAEKILVDDEQLPSDWPIQGTTGYDFLGHLNSLFVDPQGLDLLTTFYASHTGNVQSLSDVEYERKLHVINTLFPGEMEDLGAHVASLAERDRYARDISPRDISRALRELTACMPVYRTYTNSEKILERDLPYLERACEEAKRRAPAVDALAFDFVSRVLKLKFPPQADEKTPRRWLRFVRRWQQLSGPIMAKGVEDSALYVYNRLVSLNEVGGVSRPVSPANMHLFLAARNRDWPHAMNATSTHDTKRSEDTRARINVISEVADEWIRLVNRWSRWLADWRDSVDLNEEYMLLQNLVGAWPLDASEWAAFRERMKTFAVKALREARIRTSWLYPDQEHEQDVVRFVDHLFSNERLTAALVLFVEKISFYGAVNSLAQVLLKITAPGLPDFYRGTIGWDFSLVDPDNRRPTPFPELTDFRERARALLDHWRDPSLKVFLTEKALAFRKANAWLFEEGDYIPLSATGKRADHLFAFARRHDRKWTIVAVPRLPSKLAAVVRPPIGITAWRDTLLQLPQGAPLRWKNVITGGPLQVRSPELPAYRVFEHFPVALLTSRAG